MPSLQAPHGVARLLLVLALLLTACGGSSSTSQTAPTPLAPNSPATIAATPADPVTLRYAFPDDPASRAAAQALSSGFTAQAPAIRLELLPLNADPTTYTQELAAQISGDAAPDLFVLADQQIPVLREQNTLLDLSIHDVDASGIAPSTLTPWQDDERLLGLPYHAVPTVLFYNRALFDQAGERYPGPDTTWDSWRAAAQRLSNRALGVFGTTLGGWDSMVLGNGGQLLSSDLKSSLLATPEAAAGVQFAADMITRDGSAPPPPNAGGPDPVALFREGKVAMLQAPSSLIGSLQAQPPAFEWGIAPPPVGPAGPVTRLVVTGVSANAATPHPEAAASFIRWAGGEGLRAQVEALPYAAPARPDLASSLPLLSNSIPGGMSIVDALDYGRTLPGTPSWPEVSRVVNEALVPVWQGKQTAAAAYLQAEPLIERTLAG